MSDKFEYKYEAPTIEERKEIDSIRSKYMPKDETMTKIDRLRALDNKVNNVPMIFGLCFGVIGLLLFGVCMTFFLEWTEFWYFGIPFGVVGITLAALAYPMYKRLMNNYKEKYGNEILELSNELLQNDEA